MKKLFCKFARSFVFYTALALLSLPNLARTDTRLPAEVVAYLNAHYKEWKLAPIHNEIQTQYETVLNPSQSLNYITGDFNGDSSIDHAVYIAIPAAGVQPGKDAGLIVVLLKTKTGFEQQVIHLGNIIPDTFLAFVKAGTEGYNDETDETFTYKLDSFSLARYEKGFATYTYQSDRFVVSESR